jgi:hypothetical protein
MLIEPRQKKQTEPKSQDNKSNDEKKVSAKKSKLTKKRPIRSHDISVCLDFSINIRLK